MNKFTIIGDPHINPKNIDKAEVLFNLVEDLNLPTIWLGDMLDTKEIIRGKCFNFMYSKFKDSKVQHIVLVGNHDFFNLDCIDHSLQVLKELPNVQVVDSVQEIHGMGFAPFIKDPSKFKKDIAKLKVDTMFMHQDVISFDLGNGRIAEEGIEIKSLKKFKRVISGHFHKHQTKGNLTYLGTPYTQTFGESNQNKYIGIFDKENNNLELIETNFPKHVTTTINCDDLSDLPELEHKNYNRVILTGTQENISKFDRKILVLEKVKIIEKPTDSGMVDEEIDEAIDNVTQFEKWAKDIKNIDTLTIQLGTKILEALK